LAVAVSVLGHLAHHYGGPIHRGGQRLAQLCADKEEVRIWLESWGSLAPLLFIFIRGLQVVVAPIPGEVTGFLGGYLFGVTAGSIYSTLGITLGSSLAFGLGRWLEARFIEKWVKKETLAKFDFLIERQRALVVFLPFLVPGAPKDFLCIVLWLSRMPFRTFLLIMFMGRLPASFLLSLQGAKVYQGNYLTFLGIVFLLVTTAGVLLAYLEKFYQWLPKCGDSPQG
jgi:uncharacterized membrane protein YdjX (TVP38/TMEM64 family)